MATKTIDQKELYAKLHKRTEWYAASVRNIMQERIGEIIKLCDGLEVDDEKPFAFADYDISTKVQEKLRQMYSEVYQCVRGNIVREWNYSNVANDTLVRGIFGKKATDKNHFARYFARNKEAMNTFFERKQDGMNLSQRVWRCIGQAKEELELALDLGLGEGKDAGELSRDVRKYLNEPNKLFRRVRNKRGELVLSKAARAYHPGQGVYRSSYKNAMRLTRTETNMAYRTADVKRWQQLDFVVGYEVKVSKSHVVHDICDDLAGKFPKGFLFKGWHPHCYCYIVPILCSQDELSELQDMILAGEDTSNFAPAGLITEPPTGYTEWIRNNSERIENAHSLPYFIRDNYKHGDIAKGFSFDIKQPKVTLPNSFAPAASIEDAVSRAQKLGIAKVDFGDATLNEANVVLEAIEEEAKAAKLELDSLYVRKDLKKAVYGKKAKGEIGGVYNSDSNTIGIELDALRKSIYSEPVTWEKRISLCEQKIQRNNDSIALYESKLGKSKAFDKELKGYIGELKRQNWGFEKQITDYKLMLKNGVAPRSTTYAETFENVKSQAKAQIHHEFGHYVDAKMGRPKYNELIAGASDYADSSRGEKFAEWYAKYRMTGKTGIPADVLKIFEEYESTHKSQIITKRKTIAEIAEERHAKRNAKAIQEAWDERKALNKAKVAANNVLAALGKQPYWSVVDKTELETVLANSSTSTEIKAATKKLAKAMVQERKEYKQAVKTANNVIKAAEKWEEAGVDSSVLKLIVSKGSKNEIKTYTKALANEINTAKQGLVNAYGAYIDNPVAVYAKYGKSALDTLYTSVTAKMQTWLNDPYNGKDLHWLKKKLEFEINWVKSKQKYNTWQEAALAYEKQLKIVENKLQVAKWQADIDKCLQFSTTTKSIKVKGLAQELQELLNPADGLVDTGAVDTKLQELKKEVERLEKARQARLKKGLAIKWDAQGLTEKEFLNTGYSYAMDKYSIITDKNKDDVFNAINEAFLKKDAEAMHKELLKWGIDLKDNYSEARKDCAIWFKSAADSHKQWDAASDKAWNSATVAERKGWRDYTAGSGHMNRPLRGYDGGWYEHNFKGVGMVDLDNEGGKANICNLYNLIERNKSTEDKWLQRGIETASGTKGFFGSADYADIKAMIGKEVTDAAFVSCGSAKGSGFSGHCILNIYAPKGSKMIYAAPRSAYYSENETILQCGTRFKVTKVEKGGGTIYVDLEIVGYEKHPLSFT
jgi:hypothetical protein